jgi:RHS repeat-associated protein
LLEATYALGLTVISQTTGFLHADSNGDGIVDVTDLGALATNYGNTYDTTQYTLTQLRSFGDFNGDGKVDVTDLGILATEYGRRSNVQTLSLLTDGQGSTRATVDDSGNVVQNFAYDAYGVLLAGTLPGGANLASSTSADTQIQYDGMQTDYNGFQYANGNGNWSGRYYDTARGRWTTMDTYRPDVFNTLDQNPYVFVNANPINGTDPTGMSSLVEQEQVSYERGKLTGIMVPRVVAARTVAFGIVDVGALYTRTALFMVVGSALVGMELYFAAEALRAYPNYIKLGKALEESYRGAISAGWTRRQLDDMPKFFVYKTGPKATPEVYEGDRKALEGDPATGWAPHPNWWVLTYAADGLRRTRSAAALALFPPKAGLERDEFPFASTTQGGFGAHVEYVDPVQNRAQGTYLSEFYRTRLGGARGNFLIVLLP